LEEAANRPWMNRISRTRECLRGEYLKELTRATPV
jgi:hypothetical protein